MAPKIRPTGGARHPPIAGSAGGRRGGSLSSPRSSGRGMSTPLVTAQGDRMHEATISGLRVNDAIAMPHAGDEIVAHAYRDDTYPVHVTADAARARTHLRGLVAGAGVVAVISDDTVEALYGPSLREELRRAGADVLWHTLPAGEASKSLASAVELWNWLAESALGRRDVVLSFGGGVIADLGGWVASVYMRGVPYVNLPTTLLAMVDGALGGKVAVNHPLAKNLLGAFQQPAGVLCDLRYLRSLDRRQLAAGVAECIKKGVIASPEYFAFIEHEADAIVSGEPAALEALVRSAGAIKTALIERDPYEADLRRPLNFGHTVGHPLEPSPGTRRCCTARPWRSEWPSRRGSRLAVAGWRRTCWSGSRHCSSVAGFPRTPTRFRRVSPLTRWSPRWRRCA